MNLCGREAVDSAVDSGPKSGRFRDLLSTLAVGRQVDITISKLFRYSYIPENKGKVERRSKRGRLAAGFCLLRQKFAEHVYSVYLSTAARQLGVPA